MRKDLVLIIFGILVIVLGEYISLYAEPKAYWTFKGTTALGFPYEHIIPEMYYPFREFGLIIFGLGLVLLGTGLFLSTKHH